MSLSQREVLYALLQGKEILVNFSNNTPSRIYKLDNDQLLLRHPPITYWDTAQWLAIGDFNKTTTYELYVDPPKTYSFIEAWNLLLKGKKIARLNWHTSKGQSNWLEIKDSKLHLFFLNQVAKPITEGIGLNDKDFSATDWITLKD